MKFQSRIVCAMRRLYEKGLISARDGNISFKAQVGDGFFITASSVDKSEMTEDHIIEIKQKGNSYDFSGIYKPSWEINMHGNLLTHPFYDDKSIYVVHAHPPFVTAFMGLKTSNQLHTIKHLFPEINVGDIGLNVPYAEAGSKMLADISSRNLLKNSIVGLERHGTLSVGTNLKNLLEELETLEFYAKIALISKF